MFVCVCVCELAVENFCSRPTILTSDLLGRGQNHSYACLPSYPRVYDWQHFNNARWPLKPTATC